MIEGNDIFPTFDDVVKDANKTYHFNDYHSARHCYDILERWYKSLVESTKKIIADSISEYRAAKSSESAPTSTNSAMVPCPYHNHTTGKYGWDHFCNHPDKCEW